MVLDIAPLLRGEVNKIDIDYMLAPEELDGVRFDEDAPKKYYFNEAADLSTETVFLTNPKSFIEDCKKAKNIKVEIPLYQAGRPLFRFYVDESLVW